MPMQAQVACEKTRMRAKGRHHILQVVREVFEGDVNVRVRDDVLLELLGEALADLRKRPAAARCNGVCPSFLIYQALAYPRTSTRQNHHEQRHRQWSRGKLHAKPFMQANDSQKRK